MPSVAVGQVLRFVSGGNPKMRMHVCVHVANGWFCRVVSKGHWPGSFSILAVHEAFLDHDSFIECGSLVEFDESEIDAALHDREGVVGCLSRQTMRRLCKHLLGVEQITDEQRAAIVSEIRSALGESG